MTLISPEGWRPAAKLLSDSLASGKSIGEALRELDESKKYGAKFLCLATADVLSISSRDAAKIVAREMTGKKLP